VDIRLFQIDEGNEREMAQGTVGIADRPDPDDRMDREHGAVPQRRGLIAAAALAAGALAMEAGRRVAAFTLDGDTSNAASALTTITGPDFDTPLVVNTGHVAGTALSAASHQVGTRFVTSDRLLYCFDGAAWRRVLFSPILSNAPPSTPSSPAPPAGATVQPAP
jgi:hypothetical protein